MWVSHSLSLPVSLVTILHLIHTLTTHFDGKEGGEWVSISIVGVVSHHLVLSFIVASSLHHTRKEYN